MPQLSLSQVNLTECFQCCTVSRNIKHPTFSEIALNMNHLLRLKVQLCLSANEALHSLLTAGRVMGLAVVI